MCRAPLFSFTARGEAGKLDLNQAVVGLGRLRRAPQSVVLEAALSGPNSKAPGFAGGYLHHQIPIALAAQPLPTSRDFVPCRFLDAARLSARRLSSCRRPKTWTRTVVRPRDDVGSRVQPRPRFQQETSLNEPVERRSSQGAVRAPVRDI